jgi:competence protein ComEC
VSGGCRPSCSRTRSATTSAAPRRCSDESASTACSILASLRRDRRSARRRKPLPTAASRSSRREPERPNRAGAPSEDPNQLAVVLLASYGKVDALLTADAETDVTAPLLSRHVEILKVAHHGSADSGLDEELRELRPTIAVISCGRGNDYGHPRPSTVAALEATPGLSLFRTDENGRVVIESDGTRISVRSDR